MKKNYLPVFVLITMMALLAAIYGGKVYRSIQFSQVSNRMLTDIKSGNLTAVSAYIIPAQQQAAMKLLSSHAVVGYENRIWSLQLTSWEWSGDNHIRAIATCKLDEDGYTGIYQGDLLWIHDSSGWHWDFNRSYAAAFSTSGAQDWVKLGDMLQVAEHFN